jgi:formylglycine-generating enzyme required for sulfatase activity
VVKKMRIGLLKLCLLALVFVQPLQAQTNASTGTLSVMSMPVECDIRVPAHDQDWVKKTTETYDLNTLPAGDYEVFGRFEGRTISQTVTITPGQTQWVFLNFLLRDMSEVPAESPAQEALKQLANAQTHWQEQDLAKAWIAIQEAQKLYADDPEIQDVYAKINDERNRKINALWTALQQARRTKDRQALITNLCQLQKISPNHPGAQQVSREEGISFNSLDMMMLRVKPTRFAMGCWQSVDEINQLGGNHDKTYMDETPVHTVTISQPYLMSSTPVTVGQFRKFIESSAYVTEAQLRGSRVMGISDRGLRRTPELTWDKPGFEQSDDHPVVCVSWTDASAFCQWLGKQENTVYHLPTEAQWELAARAGTRTMFWWGDKLDDKKPQANLSDHSLFLWKKANFTRRQPDAKWDDGFAFTSPVASFTANPWGFHDMLGNVSEWCRDWMGPYAVTHATDPQGPAQGQNRVVRGGCWYNFPAYCRVSYRSGYRSNYFATTTIGFRIVHETR